MYKIMYKIKIIFVFFLILTMFSCGNDEPIDPPGLGDLSSSSSSGGIIGSSSSSSSGSSSSSSSGSSSGAGSSTSSSSSGGSPTLLPAPNLVSPLNWDEKCIDSIELTWDAVNDAYDYRLEIFDSGSLSILDERVSGTTYSPSLSAGTYKWRVTAYADSGTESGGEQSFFYNIVLHAIPSDFQINDTVDCRMSNTAFSWEESVGADEYEINIYSGSSCDENATSILSQSAITNPNWIVPSGSELSAGNYYAYVTASIASVSDGCSKLSANCYSFEVYDDPPAPSSTVVPGTILQWPGIEVAWNGTNFGIAGRNGSQEVHFVMVDEQGNQVGSAINLHDASGGTQQTSITAGPSGEFAVGWKDSDNFIKVQRVDSSGNKIGTNISVMPAASIEIVEVVYNSTHNEYLVVQRPKKARRLDASTGGFIGSDFDLASAIGSIPDLVWNSTDQHYAAASPMGGNDFAQITFFDQDGSNDESHWVYTIPAAGYKLPANAGNWRCTFLDWNETTNEYGLVVAPSSSALGNGIIEFVAIDSTGSIIKQVSLTDFGNYSKPVITAIGNGFEILHLNEDSGQFFRKIFVGQGAATVSSPKDFYSYSSVYWGHATSNGCRLMVVWSYFGNGMWAMPTFP